MKPKKTVQEPEANSNKLKIFYFEGDLTDPGVSEIARAFISAVKPPVITEVRHIQNGKPASQLISPILAAEGEVSDENEVAEGTELDEAGETESAVAPKVARTTRQKMYKNPEFVELLWAGNGTPAISLKDFAKEKAPKTKQRRYLVATLWLRDHAGQPSANIDQMYSCFRTAGWPIGFKDWRAPFDSLTHSKHMRKIGTGEWTITTLGEGLLQTPEE